MQIKKHIFYRKNAHFIENTEKWGKIYTDFSKNLYGLNGFYG